MRERFAEYHFTCCLVRPRLESEAVFGKKDVVNDAQEAKPKNVKRGSETFILMISLTLWMFARGFINYHGNTAWRMLLTLDVEAAQMVIKTSSQN